MANMRLMCYATNLTRDQINYHDHNIIVTYVRILNSRNNNNLIIILYYVPTYYLI